MGVIYVAFDADGRDYAYAVHPRCCVKDGFDGDQSREVAKMTRDAHRRGGEIRLLTSKQFEALRKSHAAK